ncbi:hypothetical protein AGMMS50239_35250 [Bacteroidia bacterium]|nr:hypothetical protein AGMMS50239_35250 [Bacteroidia bacterium]
MKKIIYYIFVLFLTGGVFSSCVDLDIPPVNVIQDKDLLTSDAGIQIYLAHMYTQMPFEDFKYSPGYSFFDDYGVCPGNNDGHSLGRGSQAMNVEGWDRKGGGQGSGGNGLYWELAWPLLREANYLIENLPDFKSNFSEANYNDYMGQAYFARAYVFYAMAKRIGGIPIVTKVLQYPENTVDQLEVPRSTEEESWNQVLADFDQAIALLPAKSQVRGYINKYAALGFKSEAMLYAGTVAKYNTALNITGFGLKTNVRVIGFDPNTVAIASKKYLLESYKAARQVMREGGYALYGANATDPDVKRQNMMDMFREINSVENLYIKEYKYPDQAHGYDAYAVPRQLTGGGYSDCHHPTLDYVELFDGIEKNTDGTVKVFDENGKYLLFDNRMEIFKNAEPRLKAFVILPGSEFKGQIIDLRTGIFTGPSTDGIDPLMTRNSTVDYSYNNAVTYRSMDAYTGTGKFTKKTLFLATGPTDNEQDKDPELFPDGVYTTPGGERINPAGKSGSFSYNPTGFCCRKWLNPNLPQGSTQEGRSEQHFIILRYAEILLNVAEAAAELKLANESNPEGEDAIQIAFDAIQAIRNRAGAELLSAKSELEGESGLQVIRREREKELAFEHKNLWDIRRWRIQHSKIINGRTQTEGARFKGLFPFYSTAADKYFFDARIIESATFNFTINDYYLPLPPGEVAKSPLIDQQPGK